MKHSYTGVLTLFAVGVGAWLTPAVNACDKWCVEGVIDFSGVANGSQPTNLHDFSNGSPPWTSQGADSDAYYDTDIVLPRVQPGVPFTLTDVSVLLGGVALKKQQNTPPEVQVDGYVVWAWVDVNNDGWADKYTDTVLDESGAPTYQSWTPIICVWQETAANAVINLVREGQSHVTLRSGVTYLLLIEAWAGGKCSLDFTSTVQANLPGRSLSIDDWEEVSEHNWDPSENCTIYLHGGPDSGIDDFEVLWVRVNAPPTSPGPHGLMGR